MAKKNPVEEPKFVVKKRDKRTQQAFENLTPFRHPLADIFDFPNNSEELNPDDISRTSPTTPTTKTSPTTPTTRTSPTIPSTPTMSGTEEGSENQGILAVHPVSPIRDFQKVPNSVTREAIPSGLFKSGKCKQLYDALYSLTRGAIKPQRTVRINKPRLMKMAGIGTRQTLWQNLKHLEDVGLVETNVLLGEHGGNEYTVFLPDELATRSSPTSPSKTISPSSPTSPTNIDYSYYSDQKVVPLVGIENSPTSPSSASIDIESNETPKTLFKTKEKNFDDEPQAAGSIMIEKINEAFKDFTGREINKSDDQKLAQIGELIAAEFVEAAGRTKVVSDPAAFLLTHLRRRLGVRTIKVETLSEKETGKGTPSTSKPIKREILLTDDEIQECPDCQGRLLIYPGGPGKGAVMCKHLQLIKAKQTEQSAQKKEEGN